MRMVETIFKYINKFIACYYISVIIEIVTNQ